MALYNLYAGMKNDSDALKYRCTDNFTSQDRADSAARELAFDIYYSHEGESGIKSWEDCANDLQGDNIIPFCTEADIDEYYYETMKRNVQYYAILASEDLQHPL